MNPKIEFSDGEIGHLLPDGGSEGQIPKMTPDGIEWSDDLNKISQEIVDLKANGVQQTIAFAEGDDLETALKWLEENGDRTKLYAMKKEISDEVYGYIKTVVAGGPAYTNLADPTSDDWKDGCRISSSGISAQSGKSVCNPISMVKGDVIRVKGVSFVASNDRYMANGHNSSGVTSNQIQYISALPDAVFDYEIVDDVHVFTFIYPSHIGESTFQCAFTTPSDPSSIIITKNEEIIEREASEGYAWASTGHKLQPADYEPRIIDLETESEEQAEDIRGLQERMTAIENNEVETDTDTGVPAYWRTAIDSAKAKIADIYDAGGAGCSSFVWTTDIHASAALDAKGKRLGLVAKTIMDEANIPLFVSTGDLASQSSHSSPDTNMAEIELVTKWLEPIPYSQLALIMGNHDGAWGDATSGYYYKQLPLEVMYNLIYRKQAMDMKRVSGDNGTYYYLDNVPQKIRYIMLNSNNTPDHEENADGTAKYDRFHASCCGQTQLDWLVDVLSNMPKDYTACIMLHEPYVGDYVQLVGIVDAFNNKGTFSNTFTDSDNTWRNSTVSVNFANAKGEIAGVFAGHTHKSEMRYTGNNPMYTSCPLIIMANSLGGEVRDGTTRTDGTATEFAMDIVTVDTKNRMIYMTRLGDGSDRSVSY